MKGITIINGPNLNLLGRREPEIYGNRSFEDFLVELKGLYANMKLNYFQSNHEGDIIDKLHEVGFSNGGIILNAGAYTHTSIAIADAISSITSPVVEVHISDIHSRESYRRHSYLTEKCVGFFAGYGLDGYTKAINLLLELD